MCEESEDGVVSCQDCGRLICFDTRGVEILAQQELIKGFYRCQNCECDVDRVRKIRRWRLCDKCWGKIVPDSGFERPPQSEEERTQIGRFWGWYWEMERRYPPNRSYGRRQNGNLVHSTDSYYPFCECGKRRRISPFGEPGLFGGPYLQYCSICEAKRSVESVFALAGKIMPDRDDEEWLDLLYKSHSKAFELGVLPSYWFELKLQMAAFLQKRPNVGG